MLNVHNVSSSCLKHVFEIHNVNSVYRCLILSTVLRSTGIVFNVWLAISPRGGKFDERDRYFVFITGERNGCSVVHSRIYLDKGILKY